MSRKKLGNWWLQIATAALVAVATAIIVTSFTPLGGIVNAANTDGGRAELPPAAVDRSQVEILADGVVTREEYDSAVNQTLACVRAAGGEITDLRYEDFRDRPVYTFGVQYDHPVSPEDVSP